MRPPRWTEKDIPDQTGRIAVVTGANSGVGLETARSLAARGATVVMACRDLEKGARARDEIRAGAPDARLELLPLDLADLTSVRAFCGQFGSRYPRLDLLINNAGVANVPYGLTRDGFEILMGTNFLGPFVLTAGLYPALRLSEGHARIVTVGSQVAEWAKIDLDSFRGERPYHTLMDSMRAYASSKLADLLFAFELDRRLRSQSIGIASLAAHPGAAATNLSSPRGGGSNPAWLKAGVWLMNHSFAQSPAQAALPSLRAATDASATGGAYFGPNQLGGARGWPEALRAPEHAYDEGMAGRLWAQAEGVTGTAFDVAARE